MCKRDESQLIQPVKWVHCTLHGGTLPQASASHGLQPAPYLHRAVMTHLNGAPSGLDIEDF